MYFEEVSRGNTRTKARLINTERKSLYDAAFVFYIDLELISKLRIFHWMNVEWGRQGK
jgi:hypothetical protein